MHVCGCVMCPSQSASQCMESFHLSTYLSSYFCCACVYMQVTAEAAESFASKIGIRFIETSAKTATNVEAAFLTMAKELIKNR